MKHITGISILCLALLGCSGELSTTFIEDTIGAAKWRLVADTKSALVDVANRKFGAYPNPRNVPWMEVTISRLGEVCATTEEKAWCGGPIKGIPYVTVLNLQTERYCVRVMDIYGNEVKRACRDEPPPPELYSAATSNIGENAGILDENTPPEGSTPPAEGPVDGVAVGTKLVLEIINKSLEKIGLATRITLQGQPALRFKQGDMTVGESGCKDVLDYLDSEFSDDHPGTDDYVFGPEAIAECLDKGRCRVGQIVTRAMAEACAAIPAGVETHSAEMGIIGAGAGAVQELCYGDSGEIEDCVGSPLVLDLGGNGLQLQGLAGGTSFRLFGQRTMSVGWLAGSDDALLALDLDGDGAITSGQELFGEATNGWAPDGFAALARHDANGDGVISAIDPVFTRLLAWQDDGDGRSTSDELIPVASLGIQSISLQSQRGEQRDAFGNLLGLTSTAAKGGQQIPVIDVWFRLAKSR